MDYMPKTDVSQLLGVVGGIEGGWTGQLWYRFVGFGARFPGGGRRIWAKVENSPKVKLSWASQIGEFWSKMVLFQPRGDWWAPR